MTEASDKRLPDVTLDELTAAIIEAVSSALIGVMVATGYAITEAEMTDEGAAPRLDA